MASVTTRDKRFRYQMGYISKPHAIMYPCTISTNLQGQTC